MEIPATPIPSFATQGPRWTRFAWSAVADPGDTLEAIALGTILATVTVHLAEIPEGAKVRFQHSEDGRRGWRDLEGGETAYFKVKPGDVREWPGIRGYVRPVLETSSHGILSISVTIVQQDRQHRVTGEAIYERGTAG